MSKSTSDGGTSAKTKVTFNAEINAAPKLSIGDDENTILANNNNDIISFNNSASIDASDGGNFIATKSTNSITCFDNVESVDEIVSDDENAIAVNDNSEVTGVDNSASVDVSDDDNVVEMDSDADTDAEMSVTEDIDIDEGINNMVPENEFLRHSDATSDGVVIGISDETACFSEDVISYPGEVSGGTFHITEHDSYFDMENDRPGPSYVTQTGQKHYEQETEYTPSPMYHFPQSTYSTPHNIESSSLHSRLLSSITALRTDQSSVSSQIRDPPIVAPASRKFSSQNIGRAPETSQHARLPSSISARRADQSTSSSQIIDQPFLAPPRMSHLSENTAGSPEPSPREKLFASIRSRRTDRSSSIPDPPYMESAPRVRSPGNIAGSSEILTSIRSRRTDRSSASSQISDPPFAATTRRERSPQNRVGSSETSPQKRILASIRSRRNDRTHLPSLAPGSRVRSIVGITTDTWHLNRYQTSVPLGWFQQLHKRECVKFVPRSDGNSLCHCGKPRGEHNESAALQDVYGDCDDRTDSCIVSQSTDAIIKYKFESDPIESLFIRLDYKTNQELLSFLLVQILRMRHYKFFLHFLDFEQFKDNQNRRVENKIQDKLITGLQTLAQKTQLAITSTGLHSGVCRHVHNALVKLCEDKTFHSQVFRLACPPWGLLPKTKRSRFVSKKMKSMKAYKSSPRKTDDVVMTKLSAWFNHYLLFDEGVVYDTMSPESSDNAGVFRIAIEEISARNEDAVNVYVMINGGRKVLDHVINVTDRNVPVIIVKGTGGYADRLVKNHMRAETLPKKVLDENGMFTYRSKLIPPKQLEDVDAEDEDIVRQILENNHMLTIFDPQDESQELDMVIYQALLKSQKETQLHKLLTSSQGDFIGFESQWTDFLIEALLCDSPEVVDVVLKKEQNLEKHFTSHRVIQLYNRRQRLSGVLQLLEDANAKNVKRLGVKAHEFCPSDVRLVLQNLLHDCYPLTCKGVSCQCVIKREHAYDACVVDRDMYRTCLPPIQEMFLWTLLTNHQRMAKVIWRHCEDKLASALVAEVVLTRMADVEENTDRDCKLKENAKEFSDLAVELLRTCYELDEKETHVLMRKKSAWWGNQSVMELAYSFHSRKFISQPASMSLLDRIWMGKIITKGSYWFPLTVRILLSIVPPLTLLPIIEIDTEESKGFSMKEKSPKKKWPKLRSFYSAPIVKHFMHVVTFVMFLAAFSYVLLVDLQPKFTIWQGVLCLWVATYCIEEIRQLQSVQAATFCDKWWLYWKEGWNQIDVIAIALFVMGMTLAVIPYDQSYHIRRVCLSIDFVFFCMRLLQAFSIGSEIGPMLTMILKMIRITVTFVIILIVFMISYAVASESILFPRASPHANMLYYVPRKAYWQIYGDFFLGEIEGTETDCTNDVGLYTNHTLPRCPSTLGKYLVPMMLAIYCIVTHVLMLNLLIAKFNDTYANVQGEAKTHWAWYRCLVFYEFAHRRCLPPPLNVFTCLWSLVKKLQSISEQRRCCRFCSARCRDCRSSPFSMKQTPLVEKKVRAGHTGPSSIEVYLTCPPTDSDVSRYRILCYAIQDGLQGVTVDARPDLAVTLYSGHRTSRAPYTVTNLASHTLYRLVVLYETKMGWQEYNETNHKTLFKGTEDAELHEAECVDQLDRLQAVDPIHHKLETISRAMNTMQEQFTKSINQVTGNMTQLKQKEESVWKTLTELKQDSQDMDERQHDFIYQLVDRRFDTIREHIHTNHSAVREDLRDFYSAMTNLQETQMLEMRSEITELTSSIAKIHDVQMSLMKTMQEAFRQSS